MNRRRKWADAPPFARGKVTRKALSMLKYIKAQEGPLDVTALLEALDRWDSPSLGARATPNPPPGQLWAAVGSPSIQLRSRCRVC